MISGQGLVRKSDIYPTPVSTINLGKAERASNEQTKQELTQYNTTINTVNGLLGSSAAGVQI